MKHYQGLFGRYGITVKAANEQDARIKIIERLKSYKDGGRKKSWIEHNFNETFPCFEVVLRNGFWQ